MIYCFSGTGNSRYIAKRINAQMPNEKSVNLNEIIKNRNLLEKDNSLMIFVTPTYAWRIPKIVEKLIRENAPYDNADAYFVMSCGGEIAHAGKYLKLLCDDVGLNYKGAAGIVMPENYIAMFSAPDSDKALKIVDASEKNIDSIIESIKSSADLPQPKISLVDKLYSGIVNNAFYSFFVKDKSFYVKDNCISCKRCEQLCPLNNVKIIDGKPTWQGNCTHCMACICSCPVSAIEYGKKSVDQPRYHCPK